jgi:hypothetical protein
MALPGVTSVYCGMNARAVAPLIIQGITSNGRAFRPSDWAERLAGIMSTFGGDECLRYSPHVLPIMLDGVRCVQVAPDLLQVEPRAWRFLLDFARDNDLVVLDPTKPEANEEFCPVPGARQDLSLTQKVKTLA